MSTSTTQSSHPTTSCCENGRPIMTDPHTGQTVCSCQYSSMLSAAYSRVPGITDSMYSSAYAAQGYVPFGTDPTAFYPSLNSAYDLKDGSSDTWRGLSQPTPCYPYDPAMSAYPYSNGYGGVDLSAGARRKNATRETTNTLKAWLYEHKKNPYPTKGEKIMLAIITKMTLTQVSTWFANARRRLKKENKMTWSPRNRACDDDKDSDNESDTENNDSNNNEDGGKNITKGDDDDREINVTGHEGDVDDIPSLGSPGHDDHLTSVTLDSPLTPTRTGHVYGDSTDTTHGRSCSGGPAAMSCAIDKPRIWSLADVATSTNSLPEKRSEFITLNTTPKSLGGGGLTPVNSGGLLSSGFSSSNLTSLAAFGLNSLSSTASSGLNSCGMNTNVTGLQEVAMGSTHMAPFSSNIPSNRHWNDKQITGYNTTHSQMNSLDNHQRGNAHLMTSTPTLATSRFGVGSLSVPPALGDDPTMLNGIYRRGMNQENDIKMSDISLNDVQNRTAFRPVTKSSFDNLPKLQL